MADDVLHIFAEGRVDARSLSEFLWKPADFMVQRRLAPAIHTLQYYINAIEAMIDDARLDVDHAIANAGYVIVDSFSLGATLTQRNEALRHSVDGRLYRWGGNLPKVVVSGSTPTTTGGFSSTAWVEVSDSFFREDITGVGGSSKIGNGTTVCASMSDFLTIESKVKDGSNVFLMAHYQGLDLGGEGRLYKYTESVSGKSISVATASGFLSRDFDGKVFIAEGGAVGGDFTKDTNGLQKCFNILRATDGGVLSMGIECKYSVKGLIEVNCSNIDWQFDGSTMTVGQTWLAWRPYKLGYANYNRFKMAGGIVVGGFTAPGDTSTGSFSMNMVKIDRVLVERCEFIECTKSGHILDLMGSRYVNFRRNIVRGTSTMPDNRRYAEAVQTSRAGSASTGVPLNPGEEEFWDYKVTTHVYMRHNLFEPYTNPVTGVESFPPRPIGEHSDIVACKDIHVEYNIFDNIVDCSGFGEIMEQAVVAISGTDNLFVNHNKFIINKSANIKAIALAMGQFNSDASEPYSRYGIKGNTVEMDLPERIEGYAEINGIVIVHRPPNSTCYDVSIRKNTFNMKSVSPIRTSYGVVIRGNTSGYKKNITNIADNIMRLNGGFDHAVYIRDGTGSEYISNNTFEGLLRLQTINTAPKNHPTKTTLSRNVFKEQWRAVYIATSEYVVLSGNILEGFSSKSFAGVTDAATDALGGASTITVVGKDAYGAVRKVASSGNIIIGDSRATPVKIKGVTTTRPEYEYLITP